MYRLKLEMTDLFTWEANNYTIEEYRKGRDWEHQNPKINRFRVQCHDPSDYTYLKYHYFSCLDNCLKFVYLSSRPYLYSELY